MFRTSARHTHKFLNLAHKLGPEKIELKAWVDDERNSKGSDERVRGVVGLGGDMEKGEKVRGSVARMKRALERLLDSSMPPHMTQRA